MDDPVGTIVESPRGSGNHQGEPLQPGVQLAKKQTMVEELVRDLRQWLKKRTRGSSVFREETPQPGVPLAKNGDLLSHEERAKLRALRHRMSNNDAKKRRLEDEERLWVEEEINILYESLFLDSQVELRKAQQDMSAPPTLV